MLEKIIEKFKVVNSVGENLGKVKEVFLDVGEWEVVAFEISPGMLKKDYLLKISEIEKFDLEGLQMILKDEHEQGEVPKTPVKEMYPVDELKKLHVLDKDGEKMGKIYDIEIPYEKLKTFNVWRVLIKMGIKERRLRISPDEISEVMQEIKLKKAESEYTGEEAE
ncbi:MAG: PRC-barrel domain-containing protein [Candidatus Thermoplasmatota archaeon]|nr:PRC-barrel domain-containing protein [Candidatus Thermoplasmatota archaeon]MEA3559539.1 PRC-barrel domain-containing protein [Candidatus Thermoplasmatota archaeon]